MPRPRHYYALGHVLPWLLPFAMPWPCAALAMSWPCHGPAMALPCPRHGHGFAMALPWPRHWPCHGHGLAMVMTWPCHGQFSLHDRKPCAQNSADHPRAARTKEEGFSTMRPRPTQTPEGHARSQEPSLVTQGTPIGSQGPFQYIYSQLGSGQTKPARLGAFQNC